MPEPPAVRHFLGELQLYPIVARVDRFPEVRIQQRYLLWGCALQSAALPQLEG